MKRLYVLFILAILFVSCEKDAYFIVPEGNSKLFAYSEISPNNKIIVDINTSIGVNTDDYYRYPKQSDAEISLYQNGEKLEDLRFRYSIPDGSFISQGAFRPKEGIEYSLSVRLKNDDQIAPIIGTTKIPFGEELENVQFQNLQESFLANDQKKFTIEAAINTAKLKNTFFILKPTFINKFDQRSDLSVLKIKSGAEGAKYIKQINGVLINTSKVTKELVIEMENLEPVPHDQKINLMEFELVSITEDAYRYYKSFASQLNAQSAIISEPVITFSNFENGLGLFSGFSTSIKSFTVSF